MRFEAGSYGFVSHDHLTPYNLDSESVDFLIWITTWSNMGKKKPIGEPMQRGYEPKTSESYP